MKKFFYFVFSLFHLSVFAYSTANPEISVQIMDGKTELRDASVQDQKAIFDYFVRSNPFGKYLQSYYLDKDDPALAFVNPDLLKRLYHFNDRGSEANCYFTSMLALNAVGLPERFMDLPEYLNLVQTKFRDVDTAHETLEAGDVIRLKRSRGNMELHSVVYLGHFVGSESSRVVLTKNGPQDGPYLIMNLSDLMIRVYPSAYIAGTYRKLP